MKSCIDLCCNSLVLQEAQPLGLVGDEVPSSVSILGHDQILLTLRPITLVFNIGIFVPFCL